MFVCGVGAVVGARSVAGEAAGNGGEFAAAAVELPERVHAHARKTAARANSCTGITFARFIVRSSESPEPTATVAT